MAASRPILIQDALSLLSSYLASHAVIFGRSGERQRAMRSDRRNNLLGVAAAMLRGCSLQHDGVICHFSGLWVRPLTIAEIGTIAKICPKTVTRCLADLVDLGLIKCTQIRRKNPKTGLLEVSIGIRMFTEKFWKTLGLWDFFKKSCQWAKENGKRRLIINFKSVSIKIRNSFYDSAFVVKSILSKKTEGFSG